MFAEVLGASGLLCRLGGWGDGVWIVGIVFAAAADGSIVVTGTRLATGAGTFAAAGRVVCIFILLLQICEEVCEAELWGFSGNNGRILSCCPPLEYPSGPGGLTAMVDQTCQEVYRGRPRRRGMWVLVSLYLGLEGMTPEKVGCDLHSVLDRCLGATASSHNSLPDALDILVILLPQLIWRPSQLSMYKSCPQKWIQIGTCEFLGGRQCLAKLRGQLREGKPHLGGVSQRQRSDKI